MDGRCYDIRESRISLPFDPVYPIRWSAALSAHECLSHLLQQSYRKQLMMRASASFAEKGSPPAPALTEREFCSR